MTELYELAIKEREERKFELVNDKVAVRTADHSGFDIPNYSLIDYSDINNIKFYNGEQLVCTLQITSSSVEKI